MNAATCVGQSFLLFKFCGIKHETIFFCSEHDWPRLSVNFYVNAVVSGVKAGTRFTRGVNNVYQIVAEGELKISFGYDTLDIKRKNVRYIANTVCDNLSTQVAV